MNIDHSDFDVKIGYKWEIDEDDGDIYAGRDNNKNGMVLNKEEFDGVDDMVANIEDVEWKDIGEYGWLGNPFPMQEETEEERQRVIKAFAELFYARIHKLDDVEFAKAVAEIEDCTLGCFCQSVSETEADNPDGCHTEVIVDYIAKIREKQN